MRFVLLRWLLIACLCKGAICSHWEGIKVIYACYYFRGCWHWVLTNNLAHWQRLAQISRDAETKSLSY